MLFTAVCALLSGLQVQFWDPPTGGPRKPQLFGKMSKPHNFGFLLYSARAPPTPTTGQQTAEGPYQSFNVSSYGTQQETQQLQQLRVFSAQLCRAGSSVPGRWLLLTWSLSIPCGSRPMVHSVFLPSSTCAPAVGRAKVAGMMLHTAALMQLLPGAWCFLRK